MSNTQEKHEGTVESTRKPREPPEDIGRIGQITKEGTTLASWVQLILVEYKILISVLVGLPALFMMGYVYIYDIPSIEVPSYAWAYAFLGGVAGILLWPIETKIIHMMEDEGEILHDVNPYSGDFGVYEVETEKFQDLTVLAPASLDDNGEVEYEEVGPDELHIAHYKDGVAHECVEYNPNQNVAYVSWMAGASASEIRASKQKIESIETTLSLYADMGMQEAVERPEIIRQVAAKVTLYLVEAHQKATLPEGDAIAGMVTKELQKQLNIDPASIDDYLDKQMPAEYKEIQDSNGDINMEAEHRAQVQGGDDDE